MAHMTNNRFHLWNCSTLERTVSSSHDGCTSRRMGNDIGDNSQLAVATTFSRAERGQWNISSPTQHASLTRL